MQFTYRNPARSTDPSRTLAAVRRLVVGAYDFHRRKEYRPDGIVAGGRVASYASQDHYSALRGALEVIADRLRSDGHRAIVLADQNNLVDRAAAHRAGLGWWGKSSNILVPGAGSKVLLGSVLTDAEIELPAVRTTVPDACGSCTACLSGCPTGAITAAGVVDANRCLAWLLQADGPFPVEYRTVLGDRIYGCDDCQDVCPPNRIRGRRDPKPQPEATVAKRNEPDQPDSEQHLQHPASVNADETCETWVDLIAMLDLDDDTLMARYGRWYVARRDPVYLRRNALVVLGNVARADHSEVHRVLRDALGHHDPIVRSHAVWAARRLGLDRLTESLIGDTDPLVRRELARSVGP